MNKTQEVSIPLSEYLELKEIQEHAKEVKITEKYETKTPDGEDDFLGTSVSWKSDGKCWLHLANKLRNAGLKYKELQQKYDKLRSMSVKEFKMFRKELDKKW